MTDPPSLADLVSGHVRAIVEATLASDTVRVRDQLEQANQAMSMGACMDEVLFPALREIGRRWQAGELGIEAERLATEAARGWLEGLTLRAPPPTEAPMLLLACGPADLHSIGLEALGVLLRHDRRRCRVLAPRISARMLATAVTANRPAAVVVVSHLRANRLSAAQSLRAVSALGVEVYYAGDAFGSVRLRRNVPGTHLDAGLRAACAVLLAGSPR